MRCSTTMNALRFLEPKAGEKFQPAITTTRYPRTDFAGSVTYLSVRQLLRMSAGLTRVCTPDSRKPFKVLGPPANLRDVHHYRLLFRTPGDPAYDCVSVTASWYTQKAVSRFQPNLSYNDCAVVLVTSVESTSRTAPTRHAYSAAAWSRADPAPRPRASGATNRSFRIKICVMAPEEKLGYS